MTSVSFRVRVKVRVRVCCHACCLRIVGCGSNRRNVLLECCLFQEKHIALFPCVSCRKQISTLIWITIIIKVLSRSINKFYLHPLIHDDDDDHDAMHLKRFNVILFDKSYTITLKYIIYVIIIIG